MTNRLPALFIGHGNPMNALEHNRFTAAWSTLGRTLPRPKSILCISAHWYVPGSALTIDTSPRTIHDFGGFPEALYQVSYPAPGDPTLARRVQQLLSPIPAQLDQSWGLDHGAWSVLAHLYPAADIPVVQLSIDYSRAAQFHYEVGQRLAPLREEGVLILGSGNLVHNLRAFNFSKPDKTPYDWANRFESTAKQLLLAADHSLLIAYQQLGPDAQLSIPTPEHYLPLLYILGASTAADSITFPVDGLVGGSVSMLATQLG